MAVPNAEGVHDGHNSQPDGIDEPGWQAAGCDGGTKLKNAEADAGEVEALGGGYGDDEQVDEVEVDDEIEERDAAEDEEGAGHGVGGSVRIGSSGGGDLSGGGLWGAGFRGGGVCGVWFCGEVLRGAGFGKGKDQEKGAEGEEAEVEGRRIFGDIEERQDREEVIFLCRPGVGIAITVDQAQEDEEAECDQAGAEKEALSYGGGTVEPAGGDKAGQHDAQPGEDGVGDQEQQMGGHLKIARGPGQCPEDGEYRRGIGNSHGHRRREGEHIMPKKNQCCDGQQPADGQSGE